jgi:hypothetical protein
MSDPAPSDTPSPSTPADTPTEGGQTRGLQEALKAERTRRQEMEARVSAMEAEQAKREQLAAEKRGEFEQLWRASQQERDQLQEELTGFRERETARRERIEASNAERLKALPETFRALVPPGLDAEATQEHLARLESVITQSTPTGGMPPRSGPPSVETIPQACILEAERFGYRDARTYYTNVWKPRQDRQKG